MAGVVLVTGATGFTGGFLCEEYDRLGWRVHGTSLNPEAEGAQDSPGTLHRVDLRDAEATAAVVSKARPAVVHHLAGQSSVRRSWEDPTGTILGNIAAQLNVLEAVRAHAPEARVVVVGSCDEYGNTRPEENPVRESHELRPASPYAVSKVAQDLMGLQYWLAGSVDVIRVRPFLQLGPRRADRFVAGSFARQVAEIALEMREPVIETGAIDIVRDFTDVRDVARALVLVAERGRSGDVYNISSGRGRTLRELLTAMLAAAGVRAEIRQNASRRRTGESPILIGDATHLRTSTGWQPEIPTERSAADTVVDWTERVARQKESIA